MDRGGRQGCGGRGGGTHGRVYRARASRCDRRRVARGLRQVARARRRGGLPGRRVLKVQTLVGSSVVEHEGPDAQLQLVGRLRNLVHVKVLRPRLERRDKVAHLRLDVAAPRVERLHVDGAHLHLQKDLVAEEEVVRVPQARPRHALPAALAVEDLVATLELLRQRAQRGLADVVAAVHVRRARRQHGPQLELVVLLVPRLLPDVRGHLHRLGEVDGVVRRAVELDAVGVVLEEVLQDDTGRALRVHLAHGRCHDGPRHAAREAVDVAVDAAVLRPQLDATKGPAKVVDIWDAAQQLLRHTRAVDAALRRIVEAAQRAVVADVEQRRWRDPFQVQRGKHQVNLHVVELHLDDGHVCVADGVQLLHKLVLLQDAHQCVEEVLAPHVTRRDAQRVDVGTGEVDAQRVRPEAQKPAPVLVGVGVVLRAQEVADPRPDQLLQLHQHAGAGLALLRRLDGELQLLHKLGALLRLLRGRRRVQQRLVWAEIAAVGCGVLKLQRALRQDARRAVRRHRYRRVLACRRVLPRRRRRRRVAGGRTGRERGRRRGRGRAGCRGAGGRHDQGMHSCPPDVCLVVNEVQIL
eukprot:Rhum_TRINITY_DN4792_c0_g1::Rhum_TRINITY_DN4792_c0_g1_i1::g.15418::m.15418